MEGFTCSYSRSQSINCKVQNEKCKTKENAEILLNFEQITLIFAFKVVSLQNFQ